MSTLIIPLVYPKAHEDESPVGYLIRVAEANGYKRVQWLFRADGEPFSYLPKKLLDVLVQSEWTGFSKIKDKVFEICNVDSKSLSGVRYRYCQECLKEEGYHRAHWYLTTSVVCTKHKRWLIDECPACHTKLSFRSIRKLTECICGESLLGNYVTKDVPRTVLNMQNFLDGNESIEDAQFSFWRVFNGTLYDLEFRVKLILTLARWYPATNKKHLRSGSFSGLNTCSAAAYYASACADSWFTTHDDFHRYLQNLHTGVFSEQGRGDMYFRRFYRCIFSLCITPSLQPVIDILQYYIKEHWAHAITRRNTLFSNELIETHKWVALQAACSEYDISKSEVKQGIDDGVIRAHIKNENTRQHTLVHRDDLLVFIKQQENYVNAMGAASLLGVTKQQFYSLVENDFMSGVSSRKKANGEWEIRLDDIGTLMDSILLSLSPIDNQYVSLPDAIRKVGNTIREPFITLLTAIKEHELKAHIDPKLVGFRGICIDGDDLQNWYLAKLDQQEIRSFSITSLRSYFQVSSMLVPQLIDKKLIQRVTFKGRANTRTITYQEVDKFKNRYVLLSKLSRVCDVSSSALTKLFNDNGVYPIDMEWQKSEQFVQKIYYRHELLEVQEVRLFVVSLDDWDFVF